MRLLNVKNVLSVKDLLSAEDSVFEDDFSNGTPPYAILSHTWGKKKDEVEYEELQSGFDTGIWDEEKPGMKKILHCCKQAQQDSIDYVWVDTCCIDKRNSAELSEAINSMYEWYRNASVCYAYLADLDELGGSQRFLSPFRGEFLQGKFVSSFRKSKWFLRGWTLQELIAPTNLEFFGNAFGSKGWYRL